MGGVGVGNPDGEAHRQSPDGRDERVRGPQRCVNVRERPRHLNIRTPSRHNYGEGSRRPRTRSAAADLVIEILAASEAALIDEARELAADVHRRQHQRQECHRRDEHGPGSAPEPAG